MDTMHRRKCSNRHDCLMYFFEEFKNTEDVQLSNSTTSYFANAISIKTNNIFTRNDYRNHPLLKGLH